MPKAWGNGGRVFFCGVVALLTSHRATGQTSQTFYLPFKEGLMDVHPPQNGAIGGAPWPWKPGNTP